MPCTSWWYVVQALIVIPFFIYINFDLSNKFQQIITWTPPRNVLAKTGEEFWIVDSPGCGVDTGGCGSNLPHRMKFKPIFHQRMLCNHLSPAWHTFWTGRLIDFSGDMQWSGFRNALPQLSLFFVIFLLSKRLVCYLCNLNNWSLERGRLYYYCAVGIVWVGYLHSFNALIPCLIFYIHFVTTRKFVGTQHFVKCMWLVHVGVMLLIQFCHPMKLGLLLDDSVTIDWTSYYPLLTLRMLSHCLDLHAQSVNKPPAENVALRGSVSLTERILLPPSFEVRQNFAYLFAYLTYPPLYLAGPTLTFNAFISYLAKPDQTHTPRMVVVYAIRLLVCIVLMEIAMMFMYHFAIVRTRGTRGENGLTVWEQLFEGRLFVLLWFTYVLLKLIWLKFLIIWRFARLVALVDGLDCPENMGKCMSNHNSIKEFWQSWHASFNQWLVRYIYIPLGGSRVSVLRQTLNVFVVFTFVAMWHQVSLQLVCWAWLLVLFMLPEVVGTRVARSTAGIAFAKRHPLLWDRLQVLAGAVMIVALKVACAVGFGYSLDGFGAVAALCTGWRQVGELLLYISIMYSAVRLMQRTRQWSSLTKVE